MDTHEYVTSMTPDALRDHARGYFDHHGYRMEWTNEWTAVAERGSMVKTLLLGAFVEPHVRVGLQVCGAGPNQAILRLTKINSGWMAGAIGAHKNKKVWTETQQLVGNSLHQLGALLPVQAGPTPTAPQPAAPPLPSNYPPPPNG